MSWSITRQLRQIASLRNISLELQRFWFWAMNTVGAEVRPVSEFQRQSCITLHTMDTTAWGSDPTRPAASWWSAASSAGLWHLEHQWVISRVNSYIEFDCYFLSLKTQTYTHKLNIYSTSIHVSVCPYSFFEGRPWFPQQKSRLVLRGPDLSKASLRTLPALHMPTGCYKNENTNIPVRHVLQMCARETNF